MTMAQEVLIEFIADYSSLDKAIDVLEKTGKIDASIAQSFKATNNEINKQAAALNKTAAAATDSKQTFTGLSKLLADYPKSGLNRFLLQIGNQLAEAGVEAKDFLNTLKNGSEKGKQATTSLRQELRNLTQEIATAKASGGPVDPAMIKRAGELKDAIADANLEIANAGSDTRNIDNVVGSIAALAGGFSAIQGAVGLFTDDSEELQKVLLKVNSAMALATGIQQVANAVQKEGSLTKLADVVVTKAQIVTQQLYTLVTGKATAATKLFKVALAATGIGLAIVLITALAEAFSDTDNAVEDLNLELDTLKARLDGLNRSSNRDLDLIIAQMRERGALESEVQREVINNKKEELKRIREVITSQKILLSQQKAGSEAAANAQAALNVSQQTRLDLINQISIGESELTATLNDEAKRRAERQKELNEKALQKAREQRAADFADFKAKKELEVLAAEQGSEQQLQAQKELLRATLAVNLENEKLTINQRKLLIKQFFKDRLKLEQDFNKTNNEQALQDISSDLNAELQSINLSNERKLELTESFLTIQAALEVEAANGNAAKITEINAKRERAILDARKASIQAAADFELNLSLANNGSAQRALQRVADDEKQKLDIRINAIDQLEQLEIASIDKRIAINKKLFDSGLISLQEFQLTEAQLLDQRNQVWENAEQKRADTTKRANEQIKEDMISLIQDTISVLGEVVNVLDSVFSLQSEKENQRIAEQKQKLKDLQEAGAITEKEAISRQKRIEAEERKIKQQQANRDKQIAVFQALLAIPSAILQGLRTGGPILGAIYGALAAAQAAIVIARPVPKFAKGKKDRYEGPGIMGEAGAELIQRSDGSMHVATKPTLVYVGSKDKIFTAAETRSMIPHVDKAAMRQSEESDKLDYDKLAQAIIKGYRPAPGAQINIDKDFISESVYNGLMKTNYFDKYYSSK